MSLWLPPKVTKELRQETEAYRQELLQAKRLHAILDRWNKELKQIDPYLEMVWFEDVEIVGVTPWRFHLIRHNPGAPPTPIPIVGPQGEYIEPNSRVYDILREKDLWNEQANWDRKQRMRKLAEAEERQRQREAEDRQAEIAERWKAASRAQISMNTDSPWSQNFAGRRGIAR